MPSKLISIGTLIDQTWDHYQQRWRAYLNISCWMLVVAVLNIIAIAFYPSASTLLLGETITNLQTFGVALYAFSTLIMAPLLNIFILVSLIRLMKSVLATRSANLSKAFQETRTRYWPALLVSIMYVGILFLSGLMPLLPAGIFGLLSIIFQNSALVTFSNILLSIGVVVAAVLAVRWGVQFYFSIYLVAQNDVKPRASLGQSRALVNGRFWHVFIRILAPKVVFVLFAILLMWFLNLLSAIIFSGVSGLNLDLEVQLVSYADSIIPIGVAILLQPAVVLSDVLLIKNLNSEV